MTYKYKCMRNINKYLIYYHFIHTFGFICFFFSDWPVKCGTPVVAPVTPVMRVVNGIEAKAHSWPWQVSMQVRIEAEYVKRLFVTTG